MPEPDLGDGDVRLAECGGWFSVVLPGERGPSTLMCQEPPGHEGLHRWNGWEDVVVEWE